jgi:hypothetical protein
MRDEVLTCRDDPEVSASLKELGQREANALNPARRDIRDGPPRIIPAFKTTVDCPFYSAANSVVHQQQGASRK